MPQDPSTMTSTERLVQACLRGTLEEVEKELAAGADPNGRDQDDCTPLLVAVGYHHADVVETLLKNGANPHQKNQHDLAPLHLAVKWDMGTIADKLLKYGADPHQKSKIGTPMEIFESRKTTRSLVQPHVSPVLVQAFKDHKKRTIAKIIHANKPSDLGNLEL